MHARKSRIGWTIGGAVLAVMVAVFAFWFFSRDSGNAIATDDAAAAAAAAAANPAASNPPSTAPLIPPGSVPSVPPGYQPPIPDPPSTWPSAPATSAPVDTWTRYRAPDKSFTVTAPEAPKVTTLPVAVLGTTITQSQYAFATSYDSGILVGVARMPASAGNEAAVLAGTLKGMEQTGLTIANQNPSKVGANRSIAYTGTFARDGQNYDVRGHVFLNGGRQFVILALGGTDPLSVAVYERFIGSFRTG